MPVSHIRNSSLKYLWDKMARLYIYSIVKPPTWSIYLFHILRAKFRSLDLRGPNCDNDAVFCNLRTPLIAMQSLQGTPRKTTSLKLHFDNRISIYTNWIHNKYVLPFERRPLVTYALSTFKTHVHLNNTKIFSSLPHRQHKPRPLQKSDEQSYLGYFIAWNVWKLWV
jgi:hypothetical protein